MKILMYKNRTGEDAEEEFVKDVEKMKICDRFESSFKPVKRFVQHQNYDRQTKNQCLHESGMTGKQFRKFMKKYRKAERLANNVRNQA